MLKLLITVNFLDTVAVGNINIDKFVRQNKTIGTIILEKETELCVSYHRYEFYNLKCQGSQLIIL